MSLCFKWSCDFHRFTKSKTLRISGSHYTWFLTKPSQAFSLFNLQGTIRRFRGLFRTFSSSLLFSVTAYLLYQIVFSLSRSFFNFFKLFSTRAASFRSSLFSISNREAFVKNFFHFFQILSDSAASHRSSSISILHYSDLCQHFFLYFFVFPYSPIYCIWMTTDFML